MWSHLYHSAPEGMGPNSPLTSSRPCRNGLQGKRQNIPMSEMRRARSVQQDTTHKQLHARQRSTYPQDSQHNTWSLFQPPWMQCQGHMPLMKQ